MDVIHILQGYFTGTGIIIQLPSASEATQKFYVNVSHVSTISGNISTSIQSQPELRASFLGNIVYSVLLMLPPHARTWDPDQNQERQGDKKPQLHLPEVLVLPTDCLGLLRLFHSLTAQH